MKKVMLAQSDFIVLDKKNKSVEKSLSFVDEVKVAAVHKEEVFTPESSL